MISKWYIPCLNICHCALKKKYSIFFLQGLVHNGVNGLLLMIASFSMLEDTRGPTTLKAALVNGSKSIGNTVFLLLLPLSPLSYYYSIFQNILKNASQSDWIR